MLQKTSASQGVLIIFHSGAEIFEIMSDIITGELPIEIGPYFVAPSGAGVAISRSLEGGVLLSIAAP